MEPEDSLPHSQVPATIGNRSASTNCTTRVPRSHWGRHLFKVVHVLLPF